MSDSRGSGITTNQYFASDVSSAVLDEAERRMRAVLKDGLGREAQRADIYRRMR